MKVYPAALRRLEEDGSGVFTPHGTDVPPLDDYDYVQEAWTATGEEDGHPYATTPCVRRPREVDHFSGTLIVEPLHVHGIAPIWIYCAPYILRSGHAWVEVTAQKTTLDMHVQTDGAPSHLTVGTDEPFDRATLRALNQDPSAYRERFDRRLDELVDQGWLLAEDAGDMRSEAKNIDF